MKKTKVYLSFPVELSQRSSIIKDLCDRLDIYCKARVCDPVEVEYYIPGQFYDTRVVDNCDIFVFTDIKMPWNVTPQLLPSGVREELKEAMLLKKLIFYVYKNNQGEFNFYKCGYQLDNLNICSPIAETTGAIYQILDDLKLPCNEGVAMKIPRGFDRRLLL